MTDLSYTAPGGTAALIAQWDEERYFIELQSEWKMDDLQACEAKAAEHGLEVLDPEECEVELIIDGRMRLWCALVDGGVGQEAA